MKIVGIYMQYVLKILICSACLDLFDFPKQGFGGTSHLLPNGLFTCEQNKNFQFPFPPCEQSGFYLPSPGHVTNMKAFWGEGRGDGI